MAIKWVYLGLKIRACTQVGGVSVKNGLQLKLRIWSMFGFTENSLNTGNDASIVLVFSG